MQYSTRQTGAGAEVRISGRLVFSDNEMFRGILGEIDRFPGKQVDLDLSGLEFIDSAGLGMLLIAREEAEQHKVRLRLQGAAGQVDQMLEISRFRELFA